MTDRPAPIPSIPFKAEQIAKIGLEEWNRRENEIRRLEAEKRKRDLEPSAPWAPSLSPIERAREVERQRKARIEALRSASRGALEHARRSWASDLDLAPVIASTMRVLMAERRAKAEKEAAALDRAMEKAEKELARRLREWSRAPV